jgi:glycosyltransferase involved in cell wall biosynthesis
MIELVGFLDPGQKKSALEEADCLVFPTFYEGETQGLVLLEAMSAGLAVLTTSWRGVPEVLPEGYQWVVAAGSSDELARAMVAQLGDDCGVALRRHYEKSYTIAKHVKAVTEKLCSLPEQNKASRN